MFVLPGILGLIVLVFVRPFDLVEELQGIPFLYIFCGLAIFGYVVDLKLRISEWRFAPHLAWTVAFLAWCLLTVFVRVPAELVRSTIALVIVFIVYFLLAHGVRTFKALELVALTIVACSIWVGVVCVHQGLQPLSCVAIGAGDHLSSGGVPDGRQCESLLECYEDSPDPEADYRCEHVGWFGLSSTARGRVRYVGILQDPNEVAMVLSVALPFAFALYQVRRTRKRFWILLVSFLCIGGAVVLSKSRGGQLVFLMVCGVYVVHRFGWRGIVPGALLALPILLLGGRSGSRADSSSLERLECMFEGIEMVKTWPFLGAGYDQFTEHHHLTAHNSYLLAAAELGFIGMFLWSIILYLCFKIGVVAHRTLDHEEARVARIWGLALIASFSGLAIGTFFLSFTYHPILWLYIGFAGAFYAAVKAHQRDWTVRASAWDVVLVGGGDLAIIFAIFVYTRLKLG